MGKINPALKALFSSDTRIKVLSFFLLHPGEGYYPRQLEKLLSLPVGQFSRELINLERVEILHSSLDGNQKRYYINRDFLFFEELKGIFFKTTSVADTLKQYLCKIAGIDLVFIYGSFAKGEEHKGSDLDIMIVGDAADTDVHRMISIAEKKLKQTINYSLYDRKELENRLEKKDNFIKTVFSEPKIILLGKKEDELFRAN